MPNKLQATHACGVTLLGPHDECLLVKVRLWLFTLNGGVERFQIPLCVWHRVVCLDKWKRQREGKIGILGTRQARNLKNFPQSKADKCNFTTSETNWDI